MFCFTDFIHTAMKNNIAPIDKYCLIQYTLNV